MIAAPSPDRVGASRPVNDSKSSSRCCTQRISESIDVEGPRGRKGRLIDPDGFWTVAPQACPMDAGTVVDPHPGWEVDDAAGEQTQLVESNETRLSEWELLMRIECPGHDPCDAATGKFVDRRGEAVGGGNLACRSRMDDGHSAVAAPVAHPEPVGSESEELIGRHGKNWTRLTVSTDENRTYRYRARVAVLYFSDDRCLNHLAGPAHPERPERLVAVERGIVASGMGDALIRLAPQRASIAAVERVHRARYVAALEQFCLTGGGQLDADTAVVPASWDAALLAAGSGLDAIEALRQDKADAAFCAVRPPGHHATPDRAMGFCLFNNVAVAAAALAESGERVLIVDFDVHHGNGTQEMFWAEPNVAYVSLHQWPLYPGSGEVTERGSGPGLGSTLNIPVPAGATGDVYLMAIDELVVPFAEQFGPDWLLLSAGFDAHRADPLAGVMLSAGDFGAVTRRLCTLVPKAKRIAFLEGGYDLAALEMSGAATVAALAGEFYVPERETNGGPGQSVIEVLVDHRARELSDGPGCPGGDGGDVGE